MSVRVEAVVSVGDKARPDLAAAVTGHGINVALYGTLVDDGWDTEELLSLLGDDDINKYAASFGKPQIVVLTVWRDELRHVLSSTSSKKARGHGERMTGLPPPVVPLGLDELRSDGIGGPACWDSHGIKEPTPEMVLVLLINLGVVHLVDSSTCLHVGAKGAWQNGKWVHKCGYWGPFARGHCLPPLQSRWDGYDGPSDKAMDVWALVVAHNRAHPVDSARDTDLPAGWTKVSGGVKAPVNLFVLDTIDGDGAAVSEKHMLDKMVKKTGADGVAQEVVVASEEEEEIVAVTIECP
jgi:hypothetical protein